VLSSNFVKTTSPGSTWINFPVAAWPVQFEGEDWFTNAKKYCAPIAHLSSLWDAVVQMSKDCCANASRRKANLAKDSPSENRVIVGGAR
jgi:hypothetical protein